MSNAQMAPDASPGEVSKKTGVRRVNNMPMVIGGALLMAFVIVMVIVAADRAAKQHAVTEAASEQAGNSSMFALEIAGDKTTGIVDPATPLVVPFDDQDQELMPLDPLSPTATPLQVERVDLNAPPVPPQYGLELDEEAERIRMAKLQMLEESVRAKTTVQTTAPRSSGSQLGGATQAPQNRDEMIARVAAVRQQIADTQTSDPSAAYQARLAQLKSAGVGGSGGSASNAMTLLNAAKANANSQRNNLDQFNNSGEGDRWELSAQPEAPRSPYELRAGFVMPATLVSGINSDLPGQIMAQVSQSVYDTAVGRHLLIPQGSRLVGTYSSDVAYGQSRVMVAWQRIIFPDGKAMDIGSMPGGDVSGYSGFKDKVNNHLVRLFGSAFLMSGVTAGVSLSQDRGNNNNGDSQRASDAMSEALGQQLGQVTAQLIEKNMNIAPTIEIRPGYRFNVIVTKDMTFSKPYQSFDY